MKLPVLHVITQPNSFPIDKCVWFNSKLLCPEFVSFIEQYDIIGIQESKLDDVDNVYTKATKYFRITEQQFRDTGLVALPFL